MFDPNIGGTAIDTVTITTTTTTTTPAMQEGKEYFSGDQHADDLATLAMQAEEMARLAESFEGTLEINEQDIHQEEKQWSVVAQRTTLDDHEGDAGSNNTGVMKLEVITQKIHQKKYQDDEEEVDNSKESMEGNKPSDGQHTFQKYETAELEIGDVNVTEDDGNPSQENEASMAALNSPQHDDQDKSDATHQNNNNNNNNKNLSSKSLSLAEIDMEIEEGGDESATISYSNHELLKSGVIRIDTASEHGAFVCDWGRWRRLNQQDNDSPHESRRPKRRLSNDSVSNNTSQEVSYFDWKAWKRQKQGQQSSTSTTNSLSIVASDDDDDDDGFDADSVLAKLDQWEMMEEEEKSRNSSYDEDDDDSSCSSDSSSSSSSDSSCSSSDSSNDSSESSSNSDPHGDSASSLSHTDLWGPKHGSSRANLKRSTSEHVKSTSKKLPRRSHSEHTGEQWRKWQQEKRKSQMRRSWSDESGIMEGSHNSANGSHQSFAAGDSHSTTSSGSGPTENFASEESRPGLEERPGSYRFRQLSRQTIHTSPMRSPMQKQVDDGGSRWKSWQREKRRSGMLKRTSSVEVNLGKDSNSDPNGRKKKLNRSLSEKWGGKQTSNRKQTIKRAKSFHIPNETERGRSAAFDWNAHRKEI